VFALEPALLAQSKPKTKAKAAPKVADGEAPAEEAKAEKEESEKDE